MADFNKSFNFRGGFQVDEDVFIVRGQQVGIGSTIPTARLDVDGTIKAKSLRIEGGNGAQLDTLNVGIISAGVINSGVASISNGIITSTDSNIGLVTYYGDGRFLLGLPTSQWVDIDVGLGFTSIYAAGFVGVNTNDPRYVFQVGGTPFGSVIGIGSSFGQQDGVAIYGGQIEASGIITTRGDIRAGGEFIGVGSNLTILNADNLGVGSISSTRYGDLIVTKEVIADRFIGTATSSDSLEPGVSIDISQINVSGLATVNGNLRVNGEIYAGAGVSITGDLEVGGELNLVDDLTVGGGVISTDGYKTVNGIIQVGTDVVDPDSSDIEVVKSGDANIVAISTQGVAQILVAAQRPGLLTREYGGLRRGGDIFDSLSRREDLDIVNYDIGNINFYLHSGNSGITTGDFRWIYGQNDQVLATLSRTGILSMPSGGSEPIQLNVGAGLTADTVYANNLSISQSAVFSGITSFYSDVSFEGNTNFSNIDISNINTDQIFVGDPVSDQTVITGGQIVLDNPNFSFQTILTEQNINTTTIEAVTGQFTSIVGVTDISAVTYSSSGGFSVDAAGALFAPNVSVGASITVLGEVFTNDLYVSGILSATTADLSVNSVNIAEDLLVAGVSSFTEVTCGDIESSGIATFPSIVSTAATIVALNVTGSAIFPPTTISDITVDTISAGTGNTITVNDDLDLGGNDLEVNDITAGNINCEVLIVPDSLQASSISAVGAANTINCDSDFTANGGKISAERVGVTSGISYTNAGISTTNVSFEFSGGNLVVKVTDATGARYTGTVTLTPVP